MKQRLGNVYRIAPGNLVLVRLGATRKPPRLGLKVYTPGKQDSIGRLIDVIGPVDEPFAVVKLEAGAEIGIGDILYIEPPSRRHGRKARKGKTTSNKGRRDKSFKQGKKPKGKRAQAGRKQRK